MVEDRVKRRSEERVGRVRSSGVLGDVVWPWERASRERIPAVGRMWVRDWKSAAKERPEDPAPWWVTIKGPLEDGGVR